MPLGKEIVIGVDVRDDSCNLDEVETEADLAEDEEDEEREVADWSDSEEEDDWELVRLPAEPLACR